MSDLIRVLHVDDEPDFAEMAATFVEQENDRFDIETATSASEGLDRLARADFDCVVSDYDMPRKSGIEFLEAIREEYPDLPFILYTGKGSEEVASDAISAGVTDYLQKESGTAQYPVLANRIRNAVEKYRAQTELADREKRLNLFFEESPMGVVEWDEDFNFVRLNGTAEEILGYDEAELQGKSWETIVPESDFDPVGVVVSDLLEAEGGHHSINENIRKDGQQIVCEWHNRVVTDENNDEVIAIFSQFQDITERKKQGWKRQHIIDRVTNAIVEVDADWTFTLVNKQAQELYDMSEEELLGRDFWDVFDEAQGTRFEEEYRRVMETRESASFVEYFSQLDGWFDISAYPKENGGIAFYFVEVTEQRERQRELEQANSLLSTVFATLPVGVLAEDAGRDLLAVNDRMFELFDLPGSPEEIQGTDCEQLVEQVSDMFRDADGFVKRINEIVAARNPTDNEELSLTDGRTFTRSYRPINLPNGDGHLWIYQDITERKQFERKITALHEGAQELFEADTSNRVGKLVVESTRDILGMRINGVAVHDEADNVLRVIAQTDRSAEILHADPVFRPGESLAWEAFETGEMKYYEDVSTVPERANPDTPIRSEILVPLGEHGVVLIGSTEAGVFDKIDLSLADTLATHAETALDRITRERDLEQQNNRLEEFASVVSHDLRNPLNVAEGRVELAQEECNSEHLDSVEDALERSQILIDDLLALAREGTRVSDIETVGLKAITENCWRNVATGEATITVETDRSIRADQSRLQQLLENLYRNAIEHGGDEVAVTVGDLPNGFYIEDDGPGIPADERDNVFDAGYSTTEEGTGFGLSIVKQIAEGHDWNVRVTDGSNSGARFEFTGVKSGM